MHSHFLSVTWDMFFFFLIFIVGLVAVTLLYLLVTILPTCPIVESASWVECEVKVLCDLGFLIVLQQNTG